MVLSYYIHFQKVDFNTSWELTSHFVFLGKKYHLGPVIHGYIAYLYVSLFKLIIVLMLHGESGTPTIHLLLKYVSTFTFVY